MEEAIGTSKLRAGLIERINILLQDALNQEKLCLSQYALLCSQLDDAQNDLHDLINLYTGLRQLNGEETASEA